MANTRDLILEAITAVAPEVDPDDVDGAADFIDELDLDSMDQLNIAVGVFERTGVDIPERDHAKVRTLDGFVRYVDDALAGQDAAPSGGGRT